MYEDHRIFNAPEDENIKIWRYMDFTKMVSLLDSKKLFFARADRLGDPFEGSLPKSNVESRSHIPAEFSKVNIGMYRIAMLELGKLNKKWPEHTVINCWHMNNHESAAMWRLYLKSNEGIAIQSTYARLKKSLNDEEKIYIGMVNYIDYESESIDTSNWLSPFIHKRKSYEHEKEIRAVILKHPINKDTKKFDFNAGTISDGLQVKVNLELLIESIYVAPSSPEWFKDLVDAVVKKYNYNSPVIQSKLDDHPLF